jgi:hypothetical protein
LPTSFRKISRIGILTGATVWYLSDDCLLAAKRVMYAVEYRRFYLRDLESIVVWRSRTWLLRPAIPGVLLLALGAMLWQFVNFTAGAIAGAQVWPGPLWSSGSDRRPSRAFARREQALTCRS